MKSANESCNNCKSQYWPTHGGNVQTHTSIKVDTWQQLTPVRQTLVSTVTVNMETAHALSKFLH